MEITLMALILTTVAGLTMCLGAIFGINIKQSNQKGKAFILGFSAGLMLLLSFCEMLPEAIESLESLYGHKGLGYSYLLFFGGIVILGIIDWIIPAPGHHSHSPSCAGIEGCPRHAHKHDKAGMKRTGVMLALFLAIHNFPEGIAMFVGSVEGIDVALPLFFGVALHNIPEGIAVSTPIYYATGSKKQALLYTFGSALAEPLGAVAGILLLLPYWSDAINGICLATVAGMMVYISLDELMPGAEADGHHHTAILGIMSGMAVMAASLFLLH